jgi:hypothetical protein
MLVCPIISHYPQNFLGQIPNEIPFLWAFYPYDVLLKKNTEISMIFHGDPHEFWVSSGETPQDSAPEKDAEVGATPSADVTPSVDVTPSWKPQLTKIKTTGRS